MKKKLVIAITLVLMFAILTTVLTGCDEIFKKNDQRDAAQAVATVTYGNQVSTITKAQLQSSFNSYAYSYVYYYQMTYEAAADYICESLAQRELLVLYCKQGIVNAEPSRFTTTDAAFVAGGLKAFVSNKEYNDAIEEVNTSLRTSLASIISDLVDEYKANDTTTTTTTNPHVETITDPVRIIFDANGGSSVDTQKIQKGEKADVPATPTLSGSVFTGWYLVNADGSVSSEMYDFATAVESTITLQAKWETVLAARTTRTEEEAAAESVDYTYYEKNNYANDIAADAISKGFFDFTKDELKAAIKDESDVDDADIDKYFDDAYQQLQNNISASTLDFNFYVDGSLKTMILNKYQRIATAGIDVTYAEVLEEYNRIVASNKETYAASDTAYETALKGTLSASVYQNYAEQAGVQDSYGFVSNILLKLDDDSVNELLQMVKDGTYSETQITSRRNQMLSEMQIHVSNPDYDAAATCTHHDDASSYAQCDPMTCANHKCNGVDAENAVDEYNKDNDYNNILTFVYSEAEGWHIECNVKECPTMPYLLNTVPAFDNGTQIGITSQIYASFKAIDNAKASAEHALSEMEAVYWYREMSTRWLYLVGDDSGAVSTDSNNGGLGYLVPAEQSSVDSTFIKSFTTFTRNLIKNGIGSYSTDGTYGADKSYILADSFIANKGTSGYAGIFMCMTTYVAWDENAYTDENAEGEDVAAQTQVVLDATTKCLPLNYVVTYDKDLAKCKTIFDVIYDNLLTGKKNDVYSADVDAFGETYKDKLISYSPKVYASLWKDLD